MSYLPEYTQADITPSHLFLNRRALIAGAAALTLASPALAQTSPYSTDEAPNSFEDITTYNTD